MPVAVPCFRVGSMSFYTFALWLLMSQLCLFKVQIPRESVEAQSSVGSGHRAGRKDS